MIILKKPKYNRIKKCKFCRTKFLYNYEDIQSFADIRFLKCPSCSEWLRPSKFDKKYKKDLVEKVDENE